MAKGLCLPSNSKPKNQPYYFKPGITWSDLTSGYFAARAVEKGFIFDVTGPTIFPADNSTYEYLLAYVNSKVFQALLNTSLQGMHYSNGVIAFLPILNSIESNKFGKEAVSIARADWDSFETS